MTCFLLILSIVPVIYSYDSFVYSNAPEDMMRAAKEIGNNERLSYLQSLQNKKHSDDEKMAMYSEHLSACSSVAGDISQKLAVAIGENAPQHPANTAKGKSQHILAAIGIDTVSASLMTMPLGEMEATIHLACLKNELQFQCAHGFIQDQEKIHAHILTMMENDGNIKMMFQSECKRPEVTPGTYACVGDNTDTWVQECGVSIGAYNNTRTGINIKMGVAYANAITVIEDSANKATTEEELSGIMNEAESLIHNTLNGIARLESFKCRSYYQMERCLLRAVEKTCGSDSVKALETILRVGYMRRERGDALHMQFLDSEIAPTKACSKTFDS